MVRADEHVSALSEAALAGVGDRQPCRRKTRRPPSAAALAEADRIRRARAGETADGDHVVINFADYAGQARPLSGGGEQAPGRQR